ncbi:LytR family transcriptional regulator [Arthrobacter agilis]|uniref:LCP family protein n=1 Tax=Arthrobacter agilis TaxID=37921 RepID=UPI000B35F5A5|nr:LCP family protein [Arthrobacter agilis]OUM45555.1 transcriptional regulator [Arthrobacter agilis]PPB47740.1 LytR family transcriptional regulator [Arthrobacter agilis]TPV21668.1 LytR family transcriptional regulator [Arthrobacter agilis]VDR32436.1 Membrane-bound protein lytR [Arthrobacter agilis]
MALHDIDATETRSRQRHPVRTTLLVFGALVVVAALVAGGYIFSLAQSFNQNSQTIETAFPAEDSRPTVAPEAEGAVNILLLGSDSRATPEELGDVDAAEPSDSRSDTMMLMHIPADRQDIQVMSIMRDTWTDIPGHGEAKINAAMALGGVPLVVETVEGLFDTRVDHVASIDFEGFKGLTEALGGVEVNNPVAFQSRGSQGENFDQGPITLEGDSALKFVRERYAFSDGDYQRVKNQQLFVKAVISKVLTAGTLTDPQKVYQVVNQVSPYVAVDSTLDASSVGSLALSLRSVRGSDMEFFTLPNLGTGTSADGQSIVVKDDAAIAQVAEALQSDTLGDYLSSNAETGS